MVWRLGKRYIYFTSRVGLARQKISLYTDVLDTQVARLKDGLFPNMGNTGNPAYNSIDAPLWFFWTLQKYLESGGLDCWERYGEAAKSILKAFRYGTAFNIHMRENGLDLCRCPGKSTHLDGCHCTWISL